MGDGYDINEYNGSIGSFLFFYLILSGILHYTINNDKYFSNEEIKKKFNLNIYKNFILCITFCFIYIVFNSYKKLKNLPNDNYCYNFSSLFRGECFNEYTDRRFLQLLLIVLLGQFIITIIEVTQNIIHKKNNKKIRHAMDIMSSIFFGFAIIFLYLYIKPFEYFSGAVIGLFVLYILGLITIIITDSIINKDNLKDYNKDISNINIRKTNIYMFSIFLIMFGILSFIALFFDEFKEDILLYIGNIIVVYNIGIMIADYIININIYKKGKQPENKILHYLNKINTIAFPLLLFVIFFMIIIHSEIRDRYDFITS